jgi:DNA ligase (NAD+)
MDKKNLKDKERLERLRELITYHRDLYYAKDTTEISDQAYDALVAEMITLEEKLEGKQGILNDLIGAAPNATFTKVRHKVPQWSFDNVFNLDELQAWEDRLVRYLEKEGVSNIIPTYVTEHKIDGLKIVLE